MALKVTSAATYSMTATCSNCHYEHEAMMESPHDELERAGKQLMVNFRCCLWLQARVGAKGTGLHTLFITNRKRNKLGPGRAEDLAYVHYNKGCLLKSRELEQCAS